MSVNDQRYENDGNGRLWERFQLHDINDRIENLYIHLRDVVKDYGPKPPDYSLTVNEIKAVLKEHLSKVREISGEWDTMLNNKTLEINHLKDTVRELRAKENDYKQSQVLQEGIDVYVGKRTHHLQQSLAGALRERDEAQKQLTVQKNMAKEFKSKGEQLTAIIAKMRSCDKYDGNTINDEIVAERDTLQRMYNELKVKYERNTFEFDPYLNDKLDSICETISKTEPFDAAQTRLLWQQDLDKLNRIYQQRLNQKEEEWQRAKRKSIKTLDAEYKHLENRINERLQLSDKKQEELKQQVAKERSRFEMENQQKTDAINVLKYKLEETKRERAVFEEKYSRRSDELVHKHQEMMNLQTQLSQYKILWEHFFGLDAPLKDEINQCSAKLSRFERRHNIESNVVPRKKRKIIVSSLSDWFSTHQQPPLLIDHYDIKQQRIDLFNFSKDSVKLQGFSLENQDGAGFNLDEREIRSNGYITVTLTQSDNKMHIKTPDDFKFEFKENEKLFLCDSHRNKQQIFPVDNNVCVSLEEWSESPLKATPFGNERSAVRGFVIENVTGREITLMNHYFSNKYGTFRKEIANKKMRPNEVFRLITVRDDNPYATEVQETDIIVANDALSDKNVDDALLLCDKYQNELELYPLHQVPVDDNHNSNSSTYDKCFVM